MTSSRSDEMNAVLGSRAPGVQGSAPSPNTRSGRRGADRCSRGDCAPQARLVPEPRSRPTLDRIRGLLRFSCLDKGGTVNQARGILNNRVLPALTALSENTYLSAIRAGMVSVVPLTIIGGLFMVVSYLPIGGWEKLVAPYLQLLQIPVTATFGLLAVFVCFAIGHDLGNRLKQEAMVSASMATLIFLMLQIQLKDQSFSMDGLGSKGLFAAILIALVSVRVQKFFTDKNFVIKLPRNVPPIVYESFLSLSPLFFLVLVFWLIRFILGVDINDMVQTAFRSV